LPDRLLGCEFGEPPTLSGLLAQEIFEISHRISRRLCHCMASVDLAVFLGVWQRVSLAAGALLTDRRAAKMLAAPLARLVPVLNVIGSMSGPLTTNW
jgi:hypothetical protein